MKYPLRILVFFLLIILIIPRLSYSQNDTLNTGISKFYKNSIKAKPTFIPLVGVVIFAGFSLGYEHFFHSAMDWNYAVITMSISMKWEPSIVRFP